MLIQFVTVGLVESVYEYGFSKSITLGTPVLLPLRNFAYICSIYFIILLTTERYIAICHQHKTYLISRRKTIKYIGYVILFSLVWNIPAFFIFKWGKDHNGIHYVTKTDLANHTIFKMVYINWLHATIKFFIPMTLLIILNSLSILEVIINEIYI